MSVFGLISNLFNSNSKKFSRHCSAQTTENTNLCVGCQICDRQIAHILKWKNRTEYRMGAYT